MGVFRSVCVVFLVAGAVGSAGCDAIDQRLESSSSTAANTPRVKPMKLTTEEPGLAVSLYGDSLGLTPIILDSNKVEWPVTFRVFFEEGQREFTFEEYELERVLTFEDGDVPSDIAVRDEARKKKKARRRKRSSKLKVNKVKGSENVNPYN